MSHRLNILRKRFKILYKNVVLSVICKDCHFTCLWKTLACLQERRLVVIKLVIEYPGYTQSIIISEYWELPSPHPKYYQIRILRDTQSTTKVLSNTNIERYPVNNQNIIKNEYWEISSRQPKYYQKRILRDTQPTPQKI